MGFLDNYESVEDRIPKFWADHPNGRMVTDLIAHGTDEWVFRCELFREGDESPWATGHAHEEKTAKGVNATSACENCETSAIGRALANAGYAAKGKRASREEMSKTRGGEASGRSQTSSAGSGDNQGAARVSESIDRATGGDAPDSQSPPDACPGCGENARDGKPVKKWDGALWHSACFDQRSPVAEARAALG